MLLQGVALVSMALWRGFGRWSLGLVALGVGTALVYPTLIAAVGDIALPSWRGVAVGVYRLWRDLGYVAGALLAGVLTDAAGAPVAIVTVGALTALSGIVVAIRFRETHVVAEHSDLSLRRSA
jgi:MFS family permease